MRIVAAQTTHLFIGTEAEPRQVVRVRVAGTESDERQPSRVRVRGEGITYGEPVAVGPLGQGEEARLEMGVQLDSGITPGTTLAAEVMAETGSTAATFPFELTVAEPGWRMFMVSHFHYDPVWWNTQAAYTETWAVGLPYRLPFQEPGFALVKAHLDMARRDADYKFVLAELDYLKPYWGAFPEDRAYVQQLLNEGRLELMGGTYNEPNTNLTSAESTIRNAIYGIGYQRDVLGGAPTTAWQLDAFGHDPQFPGMMADAGLTSSSWARGPFHEWGPHWVRGALRQIPAPGDAAAPRMQFASEFDWVAPSGRSLLTCFMANHYSAGWWMDSAVTLEEAEAEVDSLFTELQSVAATKNVLLPVGTDYTPPNRWLTAIHRDWNQRYVWPRFEAAIPREFFAAVRDQRTATGRGFSAQSRDMNPIYTGKDVSFIDTKQAQRVGENTLLSAEKLCTIAWLLGAPYPTTAIDKAWRQLLFGAHHDGITGSESDQVYLDLLGGWREAQELASAALDGALGYLAARIDTRGDGWPMSVFNVLSWPRTDVVHATAELPQGGANGIELRDGAGESLPFVVESVERHPDGSIAGLRLSFVAADVPALGYRTYRLFPAADLPAGAVWREAPTQGIASERYTVEVDPGRGGAVVSIVDRRTGKQLLQAGRFGNELLAYREYPTHPHFGEGPWHLTPDGTVWSSADGPVEVTAEESAIGHRLRVRGPFADCQRTQEIVVWDGVDRVEFVTRIDGFAAQDRLFRVRFAGAVEGGMAVSEVGNAVIGRPFGFPNADVAEARFTLDNPAYNWFGLGATARVALVDEGGRERASRAWSVAEVIVPDDEPLHEAARELVVALVRQGVTSTLAHDTAPRYGILTFDSNLPDVRLSIGGPDENRFTAAVFEAAGEAYAEELQRQLRAQGWARAWIPADRPLAEVWRPKPDLRGVRDLPVLVVAGADSEGTREAISSLCDDLADAVVDVAQPLAVDGSTDRVEDHTLALLNRGTPGFNVEVDGSLYLSLLRSCSGWPSGVWIDPPRRTAPDGSNFQFEHWSHRFEYALASGGGDWRRAELVRIGHEYNNPLIARSVSVHEGELPAAISLGEVTPPSAVLAVLKPAGNALASMSMTEPDPDAGLALRVYESSGRPTPARVRLFAPIREAFVTNVLEEERGDELISAANGSMELWLDPYAITTTHVALDGGAAPAHPPSDGDAAPLKEPAQPVFADYWLHNKGPAPLGYQPVTVSIRPAAVAGSGPFTLPVTVASERTDGTSSGSVRFLAPPGWQLVPEGRMYSLAPGAHLAVDVTVTPAADAVAGRYFVAAQIDDRAGQVLEDVVTVDYLPDGSIATKPTERSPLLSRAVQRALHEAESWNQLTVTQAEPVLGGELVAELLTDAIRVKAGEPAELRLRLVNRVASEVRGEAQLVSPHDTWAFSQPWTQGFAVAAGEEQTIGFRFEPPGHHPGGSWWALVKVMYFGRLHYTEAVRVEVAARPA